LFGIGGGNYLFENDLLSRVYPRPKDPRINLPTISTTNFIARTLWETDCRSRNQNNGRERVPATVFEAE
jgi:hypothetical protein